MRIPDDSLDDYRVAARKPAKPPSPKSVQLTGEVEVVKPLATGYIFTKGGRKARPGRAPLSWFHSSLAVGGALAVFALVVGSVIFFRSYRTPVAPVAAPAEVVQNEQPEILVQPPADAQTTPAPREEPETSGLVPMDFSPESGPPSAFEPPAARTRVARSSVRSRSWIARPPKAIEQPMIAASPSPKTDLLLTDEFQLPKTDLPVTTSSTQPKNGVLFVAAPRSSRHLLPRPTFVMSSFVPTTLVIFVENGVVKTRIEPWLPGSANKPSLP